MVTCLKFYPSKNGISSDLIPEAIILFFPQSILQQVKNHSWGLYTGLHRHHKQHQTDNSRSNCTESRKITVKHYFMSLATIKKLHTYIWIELSIILQVIYRVD